MSVEVIPNDAYGGEVAKKQISMKRRSGTADDRELNVQSEEKRLKLNKNDRAYPLAGQQKKPPKFAKPSHLRHLQAAQQPDLTLSPEKANVMGRKSPSQAQATHLPQSLHSEQSFDGGSNNFKNSGNNYDIQHISPKGEQMQQQVAQANVGYSDPQAPVTTIAETHQVNDQFIENIRAKLDMLD